MAFRYTEEHYHEKDLSLGKVTEQVNLKPATLSKKIHEELSQHQIHITWTQYLNGLRIRGAMEYLRDNPFAAVKVIKSEVGYKDLIHFKRMFERFGGIPLAQFKKRVRERLISGSGMEEKISPKNQQ